MRLIFFVLQGPYHFYKSSLKMERNQNKNFNR